MTEEIIEDIIQEEGQDIEENQAETSTEDVATEPESEVSEQLAIPENWESPIKDFINGIEDVEGRKAFFDKFKSFDDGYQKKYSDLGSQRKEFEEQQKVFENDKQFLDSYRGFENAIDPEHKTTIMAKFGNIPSYMNSLMYMDKMASENPSEFLINFCKNIGINRENLDELLSGKAYQQHATQSNNKQLEASLMKKVEEKFLTQKAQESVQSFAEAKNEKGELKHPHFENVRNVMANLESAYPDKSLEELYDMAVYTDPKTRESILQSQVQEKARNLTNQNEVKKAKSVMGVKTSIKPAGLTENKSWQEILNDELD